MSPDDQDYYELLGVPRDASPETIRHVYRQLARAYHPDANPGNPVGEEHLKLITEAWETLSDPALRARYDSGVGAKSAPFAGGAGGASHAAGAGHPSATDAFLSALAPEARRLATDQPPGWEYLLFPQVLQDEIDGLVELKQAYVRGVASGPREQVTSSTFEAWADPQFKRLDRLVAEIEGAINVRLPPAFGALGEAGDAREIVAVARLIAARYREVIEWSLRVRCAAGPRGLDGSSTRWRASPTTSSPPSSRPDGRCATAPPTASGARWPVRQSTSSSASTSSSRTTLSSRPH